MAIQPLSKYQGGKSLAEHRIDRRKPKGITARLRASRKRRQSTADKSVYAAVDARDGFRSRLSGQYCGDTIHRHHIVYRSQGGKTTLANVISLTPEEHAAVHAGTIRLLGTADSFAVVRFPNEKLAELAKRAWQEDEA